MRRELKMIVTGFSYTEGPRWRDGRLWFSDFYTHQVTSVLEDGSDRRLEATVPGQPSGLGWLPDGRLLVVSMRDGKILRREADGTHLTHADVSSHITGLLNDLVVDKRGRAYVGNFGFDLMAGADIAPAPLLRVDPDGAVSVAAPDLLFPNGAALTPDGRTLLVAETFGNRITAFDVTEHDGALSNRRDWAALAPPPPRSLRAAASGKKIAFAPDGLTLDAEGAVWVADTHHARLLRLREGGEIAEEIRVEDGCVFACCLGGADGRTLFACVAPDFYEATRKAALEACIMAVKVDVPLAGTP